MERPGKTLSDAAFAMSLGHVFTLYLVVHSFGAAVQAVWYRSHDGKGGKGPHGP